MHKLSHVTRLVYCHLLYNRHSPVPLILSISRKFFLSAVAFHIHVTLHHVPVLRYFLFQCYLTSSSSITFFSAHSSYGSSYRIIHIRRWLIFRNSGRWFLQRMKEWWCRKARKKERKRRRPRRNQKTKKQQIMAKKTNVANEMARWIFFVLQLISGNLKLHTGHCVREREWNICCIWTV